MNSTPTHLRFRCLGQQLFCRQTMATNRLTQNRSIFGFGKKKTETKDPKEMIATPLESEVGPQYTDEEVMRMRDVSRLPPLVKSKLTGKDIPAIKYLWQMQTYFIRTRYADWGRATGLKPGVMWPSKEELEWQKGYEKAFCKPFHQMRDELKQRKRLEQKTIKDREEEVMTKLKDLPKMKKEFWDKYHKMRDQLEEEKSKKEKLIQAVRECVGYDLDPNDPRFDEALLKKDEEKKKAFKALKKQEKQKAVLEKLQQLATEAMEREREEKAILDKSKSKSDTKQTEEEKIK